jgi:type IV pilus assembly protein PilC
LIEAGAAPAESVMMLGEYESSADGKEVMASILNALDAGSTMSESLNQTNYFPVYMVNMLALGEKTGHMTSTFKALADFYDRQDRIEVSVKNAIFYPLIVLIMMVSIMLILIVQVLPMFNETFNRMGVQMNALAAGFMRFGSWLNGISLILVIILGVIAGLAIIIWVMPSVRSTLMGAIRKKFGHHGLMGDISMVRFMSALALTTASGLDTEDAVVMASTVSGGASNMEAKYKECQKLLNDGHTLFESIYRTGLISSRDNKMLMLGARGGMADVVMEQIVERKERRLQDKIDKIISRLEPTLVIISSVLIGIVLLSVMLPLMSIMTSIS